MPQKFNETEFSDQLELIKIAAKDGELEVLRGLHTQLMAHHNGFIENPNARELLQTQPIELAAENNRLDCVRFLLPWSDLHSPWNRAIEYAASHGYTQCVQLLIPHSSEDLIRCALVSAAHDQQWECVNIIFDSLDADSLVNIQEDLETTLLWSSQYHQYDLLQRVYPFCNIERALAYAQNRWNCTELLALTDYHTSVQQNKILSSVVERTGNSRRSKI